MNPDEPVAAVAAKDCLATVANHPGNDWPVAPAGVPGTMHPDTKKIRWHRLPDLPAGRAYSADVPDGIVTAVVSHDAVLGRDRELWHVSVAHVGPDGKPGRYPTWDELKYAAYQLLPADVPLALLFPRKSATEPRWLDAVPTCLHLWEVTDADL